MAKTPKEQAKPPVKSSTRMSKKGPLTPEQLDAIQALAQAQGITGDRASLEGRDGPCALEIGRASCRERV